MDLGIGFSVPQRAVFGGGAPAPTYRQLVSSRAGLLRMEAALNLSPSDSTWTDCRRELTAREALSDFQVTAVNASTPTNGTEAATGASHTMYGMLEYPEGVFNNFLWSGASSKVITNGNRFTSDTLEVSVPDGATYWIWTRATGTAFVMPAFSSAGGTNDTRASGTGSPGTFGDALAGSGSCTGFCAITALTTVQRSLFALIGDSNVVPQSATTTRDAELVSGFSWAFTNLNLDHLKFAASGSPLIGHGGNLVRRIGLMNQLGCTRAIILLGTNNLSGTTDNSVDLIAEDAEIAADLDAAGIVPHFMTIPPRKNSGVAQGETARLALNASRRSLSGTGIYGEYYELADVCETSRDSGDWKSGYTNGDNLHIDWTASTPRTAIVADFQAWLADLT